MGDECYSPKERAIDASKDENACSLTATNLHGPTISRKPLAWTSYDGDDDLAPNELTKPPHLRNWSRRNAIDSACHVGTMEAIENGKTMLLAAEQNPWVLALKASSLNQDEEDDGELDQQRHRRSAVDILCSGEKLINAVAAATSADPFSLELINQRRHFRGDKVDIASLFDQHWKRRSWHSYSDAPDAVYCEQSRPPHLARRNALDVKFDPEIGALAFRIAKSRYVVETAEEETYEYRPLLEGEIRLIELQPGHPFDDLRCVIRHYPLQKCYCQSSACRDKHPLKYDALSYTWGDQTDRRSIICSDTKEILSITANCYSALKKLRSHCETRLIWVDAICINQKDVLERNSQVRMMTCIYKGADGVIVDLGEETRDSETALAVVSMSNTALRYYRRHGGSQEKALVAMLRRPWFRRVWVLQEVAWGWQVVVICGFVMTSWESSFGSFGTFTQEGPEVLRIKDFRKNLNYSADALLQNLCRFRYCDATDPRDKVFAVMALFENSADDSVPIRPDYSKSMEELYISVAIYMLGTVGVKLLSAVCGKPIPEGPSWVPDWSIYPELVPLAVPLIKFIRNFDAGRGSANAQKPEVVEIAEFGLGLKLRSLQLDSIWSVSDVLSSSDVDALKRISDKWENIYREAELRSSNYRHLVLEMRRFDEEMDVAKKKAPEVSISESEFFKSSTNFWGGCLDGSWPDYLETKWGNNTTKKYFELNSNWYMCIASLVRGRRYFTTRKGYLGIGPAEIRIGDTVHFIEGGPVPIILRSVEQVHTLVGDCYMQGLMHGAVWQRKKQRFSLRDIIIV